MTCQLHEREVSLREEATREKAHANMLESYNQLLMQLIDRSNEDILVTSVDHQEILYRHQRTSGDTLSNELYALCIRHLTEKMQTPFKVSRHMNGSGKQKIPFTAFTASRQV